MKNIRNFRDKKYGWGENGSIVGVDLQGTAMEKQIAPETISYYHYFFDGEISRDCCYQCPYAQRQRVGDITVGDIGAFRNMIRSFWWNREERSIAKKAFPAC